MAWAEKSALEQPRQWMKIKGKLTRTQKVPTACQDFLFPYLSHRLMQFSLSLKYPTKRVERPSAIWN